MNFAVMILSIFAALGVVIFIFMFAIYTANLDAPARAKARSQCEVNGGVYVPQYRTKALCLKKEAVIDLR